MTSRDFVLDTMQRFAALEATTFRGKAISENLDGTQIINNENWIPEWKQGKYDIIGIPVQYQGQIYKVWQKHDSTSNPSYNPKDAVSLFDILHTKDPAKAKPYVTPQGTRGLYKVDECCIWNDIVYRCKQDTNYNPSDYAQAWVVANSTQPPVEEVEEPPVVSYPTWDSLASGYAFKVGDFFIDGGKTYQVLRQFSKQANWRPPALINDYYKIV